MKVIKPLRLGVLHRTFERSGECHFVASVLVLFDLAAPDVPRQEVELWTLVAEELAADAAFDECMIKTQGEVLVYGSAYPPGERPAPACAVRLQLGTVDKRLFVVGDRVWEGNKPSDPAPFTAMAVDWAHAYGGEGYEANPTGKGFARVEVDGKQVQPLPNVENPKQPVSAPGEKVRPAGLGSIPLWWPQRMNKAGTHDKAWLKSHYPGFAPDIDWGFFNCAQPDQWIDGHFQGGEAFSIENMHPEEALIEGRLPDLTGRCFVVRKGADGALDELPLRMDTVHLFPGALRGVAVYRGSTVVQEDDAADIEYLVVACDRPGELRPVSHYKTVLENRLDKTRGAIFLLRDSDLIPPGMPDVPLPGADLIKMEGHMAANLEKRADLWLMELRETLTLQGIDPDERGVPAALPPTDTDLPPLDELPEYIEEQQRKAKEMEAEALRKRDEILQSARAMCEEHGFDFDQMLAEQRRALAGPPDFSATREMDRLRAQAELGRNAGTPLLHVEELLADEGLLERLQDMERGYRDTYRRMAHHFPAAQLLAGDEAQRLREEVMAVLEAGGSLAGRDLTGANLSELDLSGADLNGAFMEEVDLSGADLSGADLRDVVLARANLTQTKLSGARLAGANLGKARLIGTDLSGGVELSDVTLFGAVLDGANLSGARLERVQLIDTQLRGCNLSGVSGKQLMFVAVDYEQGVDLRDNDLSGCELCECYFLYANLQGVNLSGATLRASALLACNADGACFDGADCTNLRVVYGSIMNGASLRGAKLELANLQGTPLRGSDLTGADLSGANLMEADFEGASLQNIKAHKALLIRANLAGADLRGADMLDAILQKATIDSADFRDANMYRVDFAKIKGNRGTKFDRANMKRIRFVERTDG